MKAIDVVNEIWRRSGMTQDAICYASGRRQHGLDQYFYRTRMPTIRLMAEICQAAGFELIVRSLKTGEEIVIDPPPRD